LTTAVLAGRVILTGAVLRSQIRNRRVGNAPKFTQESVMPEYQPVSSAHVAAIERPRCPSCNQNRMLLSKLELGRSGLDCRTFECQKCGRVQTTLASSDPMASSWGWVAASELKPPT
jgi:ribosomal protein S14